MNRPKRRAAYGVGAALLAAVLLAGCVDEGHWRTYKAAQGTLEEAAQAEWLSYELAQNTLIRRVSRLRWDLDGWTAYRHTWENYRELKAKYDAEVKKMVGDAQMAEQAAVDAAIGTTAEWYYSARERLSELAKALMLQAQAPDIVDAAEKARRRYEKTIEALKRAAPAEWAAFEAAVEAVEAADPSLTFSDKEARRSRGKRAARYVEAGYAARLLVSPDGSFPLVP